MPPSVAFVIPALNEEKSIGLMLDGLGAVLPSAGCAGASIFVVDNGSTDATAAAAGDHGATVVREPRRGYGQACLAGIAALSPEAQIVVFLDADGSDDPTDLAALLQPIRSGDADFVLGSRTLGERGPGAFTPQQQFGNWLVARLMRLFFGACYTDLGPFRAIRRSSLELLHMRDTNYGWTIEMQIKAYQKGLHILEIPARYRRRKAGSSKVSGNLRGTILAGMKILWTITRFRFARQD